MQNTVVKRIKDRLSAAERSALMAKVKPRQNKSTEMRVAAVLIRAGVRGWKRHPKDITGRPDFYFPSKTLAIFVDGCFWHGCPRCRRNVPTNRREFWTDKIAANRRRDRAVNRALKQSGLRVLRIWEHSLNDRRWVDSLLRLLASDS